MSTDENNDSLPIETKNLPIAKAGIIFEVNENTCLVLSGIASSDLDFGNSLNYSWKQITGISMWETLSRLDAAVLALASPAVSVDTLFTFELTVTDKQGLIDIDEVNVLAKDAVSLPLLDNNKNIISSNDQKQKSTMNIEIEVAEDPTSPGDDQTLTFTVLIQSQMNQRNTQILMVL
jgi:hypothetical protein